MENLNKDNFMKLIIRHKDFLIISFLILVSSILIFHNLGNFSVQDWDEARHAENALEILKTHDWVVLNYGGQPDFWNLKPPLGAWLIAISFKIFGLTAFALRFWSAIAGIGIILLAYFFGKAAFNRLTGVISAMILLIMPLFIVNHGVRTGNYDVLLTFFIILSFYLFYLYEKSEKPKFLIFTGISLALAIMTKGFIGIFPILIILIYCIFTKSFKKIIRKKEFLYSILCSSLVILPWFFMRLLRGKEFFIKMINIDILQRSSEVLEGHTSNWYFYFETLKFNLGLPFSILALIGFIYLIYLVFKKNKFALLLVLWISFFLTALTIAKTRLFWYIIPIYPAFALLIGYFLSKLQVKFKINKILFFILFFTIILFPFFSTYKMANNLEINPTQKLVETLKDDLMSVDNLYIYKENQFSQGLFFVLSSSIKGNVIFYENINDISLRDNDFILVLTKQQFDEINTNIKYKIIKEINGAIIFGKV